MAGVEDSSLWLGGLVQQRVAVIGAGWAGCAAAVAAVQRGWQVDVYEAAPHAGGRAKAVAGAHAPNDADKADTPNLDNGQHILLGAYSACLSLMQTIGVDIHAKLLRCPLDLRDNQGRGFALPSWASSNRSGHAPATATALSGMKAWGHEVRMAAAAGWGVAVCSSWPIHARMQLLWRLLGWRLRGFKCHSHATVADLCLGLHGSVMQGFIEPLCVSALNLSTSQASAALLLRVLKDALLSQHGSSDMLLPKCDLSTLLVEPCLRWLHQHHALVHTGARVTGLLRTGGQWRVQTQTDKGSADTTALYDHVIVATPAAQAASLSWAHNTHWANAAAALDHTAIATVYASSNSTSVHWRAPMVALNGGLAQFAFNRTALLGGTATVHVAAVVSDSGNGNGNGNGSGLTAIKNVSSRDDITHAVMQQLRDEWPTAQWQWTQTVVEKRACFACTPTAARPVMGIAPHLWACGDYVAGPYPSTLEGAVRSGQAVVSSMAEASQ